jgi:hypothetical protein
MLKPIKLYETTNFANLFAEYEHLQLAGLVYNLFLQNPFDMFVGEPVKAGGFQIRVAGYHFETRELDEHTIVYVSQQNIPTRFWVKTDDYGQYYVMTFLLPSDY